VPELCCRKYFSIRYTKADIPNDRMNDSRLAFFTSAFDDTAVTANPPRSSSCVISCLDAFEGFAARSRASPGTGPAALPGEIAPKGAAFMMNGVSDLKPRIAETAFIIVELQG